jgi:hypothetical protein
MTVSCARGGLSPPLIAGSSPYRLPQSDVFGKALFERQRTLGRDSQLQILVGEVADFGKRVPVPDPHLFAILRVLSLLGRDRGVLHTQLQRWQSHPSRR